MKSFGKRAIVIACVAGLPAWAAEIEVSEASASSKEGVESHRSDSSDPRARTSAELRVIVATGVGALGGAAGLTIALAANDDPPIAAILISHAVGTALGASITTAAFGVGSPWVAALGVLPGYMLAFGINVALSYASAAAATITASQVTTVVSQVMFVMLPALSGALCGEWSAQPYAPAPGAQNATSAAVLPFVSSTRGGAIAGAVGRF